MAHKAPGKHYRQGMTLIEAMRMFADNAAAEAWFVKVRWPNCGSVNVLSGAKHKTMPYRCREKEANDSVSGPEPSWKRRTSPIRNGRSRSISS